MTRATVVVTATAAITIGGVTAGLTISSSGDSVAQGASKTDAGKVDVAISADDLKTSLVKTVVKLAANGYSYKSLVFEADTDCVSHSSGKVQEFFQSNPCKWLARAYVGVQKGSAGLVLVDFIWVDMPTYAQAEECQRLMETSGSGTVTELARETGSPYQNAMLPIAYYSSGISGTAVWLTQAQPFTPVPINVVTTILNNAVPSF